jgi:hypothetical protein
MLKSRLKWSATWLRGVTFCHRGPVDCWILARGIDCFLIATPDHVDSSCFIVWISLRANLDDRIVIDGVSIVGHPRLSIGFVVASRLTAAWKVVAEFLRPRGNSKSIVVVRRSSSSWVGCSRSSSCSWAGCSRSSSSSAVNDSVPNRNHTSVRNFYRRPTEPWVHQNESQRFHLTWCASVDSRSSDSWRRNEGNASRRNQSYVNMRFRLVQTLWRVITLRPV